MSVTQCRVCGHKVEIFKKKCSVCGGSYPSLNLDSVAVLLIVFLSITVLGIYLFMYIIR